jgi:hypothetical protein
MADAPHLNAPASGSYGEGQAQQELQAALPVGAPPAPQGAPLPPMGQGAVPSIPQREGRPTGPTPPPGIPSIMARPTDMPNVPLNTPLAAPGAVSMPQAPDEARLQVLQTLASSPNVSQTTRQWARQVIALILGQRNQQ